MINYKWENRLRGVKIPRRDILLRIKQKISRKCGFYVNLELVFRPIWLPRNRWHRVGVTWGNFREFLGTGHGEAGAWSRPRVSDSLCRKEMCCCDFYWLEEQKEGFWQSWGLQTQKEGYVLFFSVFYQGNCSGLRAALECNSWGGTDHSLGQTGPLNTLT